MPEITYLRPRDHVADPYYTLLGLADAVARWTCRGPDAPPVDCHLAREVIDAAEALADAMDACEVDAGAPPSSAEGVTWCPACEGAGPPHYCARCGRRLEVAWWPRRHRRCPACGVVGIGTHHQACTCRTTTTEATRG